MEKHDYAKALEWLEDAQQELLEKLVQAGAPMHPEQQLRYETIRHALLLADKVTGEPSAAMKDKGYWIDRFDGYGDEKNPSDVFKAMIQQAEREI